MYDRGVELGILAQPIALLRGDADVVSIWDGKTFHQLRIVNTRSFSDLASEDFLDAS